MKRLFVALDLPDPLKDRLWMMSCGVEGARWSEKENLHLTLFFIGEADGLLQTEIDEALEEIHSLPFPLQLKGVGHFPPRGNPRVLWVGVADSEPLLALQNKVKHAMNRLGVESEERRYTPHVTVAKLRDATEKDLVTYFCTHSLFSSDEFTVDSFHLYESYSSPKGSKYTRLATYPLKELTRLEQKLRSAKLRRDGH